MRLNFTVSSRQESKSGYFLFIISVLDQAEIRKTLLMKAVGHQGSLWFSL